MKTLKQVEAYAKKVIPLLNLNHWEFEFKNGDGDYYAMAEVKYHYKEAEVKIGESFWKKSKEYKEITVIHELLHCHCGFWKEIMNRMKDNPDQCHNRVTDMYNCIADLEEEPVELLARAIHKLINNKKIK